VRYVLHGGKMKKPTHTKILGHARRIHSPYYPCEMFNSLLQNNVVMAGR
jgi:hypothetical protein